MKGRAALWLAGIALMVGGFAVAIRGVEQNNQLIERLVRTPTGCSSTVDVASAGTYYVYVETKGRVEDLGGCDNDDRVYDLDDAPSVDVNVRRVSGSDIELTPDDSVRYSGPAGVGRSVGRIEVTEAGRYIIEVRSAETAAVVTLGRDAAIENNPLLRAAVVVVLTSILLLTIAIIATIRGRRRARTLSGTVVVYGTNESDPMVTWAPPRPEDRAPPT